MEEVDCRFMVLPARAVMSVKVPIFQGEMEVLRCEQKVFRRVNAKRVSRSYKLQRGKGFWRVWRVNNRSHGGDAPDIHRTMTAQHRSSALPG